jgi:membrane-associated phospholipid phosphatase
MYIVNKYCLSSLLVLAVLFYSGAGANAQSMSIDSSSGPADSSSAPSHSHQPVYFVNYWVSVPIILVGGAGGLWLTAHPKDTISNAELAAAQANPNNVPSFDRLSLHQNMALVPTWDKYAQIGQITGAAMPFLLLIDGDIRQDWLPMLTIGLEVNMVALGIYSLSPLGPSFQTRYRPLVYYSPADAKAAGIDQEDGNNKDSFFSGHVSSVAASSFFMAKVYCDYHPDANQYLIYSLAALPPIAMGWIRIMTLDHFPSDIAVGMTVGTLCGVLIPELHKIGDKNLSIGAYSSPTTGTGLTLNWNMGSD